MKHYGACAYCEIWFFARRSDARYCSASCRTRAYNRRQEKQLRQDLLDKQQGDLRYLARIVQYWDLMQGGAGNAVAEHYLTVKELEQIALNITDQKGKK